MTWDPANDPDRRNNLFDVHFDDFVGGGIYRFFAINSGKWSKSTTKSAHYV